MAIESTATSELNIWQRVAAATHDIVTPANLLDVTALVVGYDGSKNLDTWPGIVKSGIGFGADAIDGAIAGWTGTRTELGSKVDKVGDKIKLAYTLPRIWEANLAPRSLIVAVAAQNLANVAIVAYDQTMNDEPKLDEATTGRRVMAAECFGIGLHVIGNKVEKSRPAMGRAVKAAGSVLGWSGVAVGFAKTTPDYWRQATAG